MKKSFNTCDITSASSENSNAARENRNSEVNPVQIANTTTSSSENAGTARRNRESEDISAQNTDITSSASENSNATRLICGPEINSVQYTDLIPTFENRREERVSSNSEDYLTVKKPVSDIGKWKSSVEYDNGTVTVSIETFNGGKHIEKSATYHPQDGSIDYEGHITPIYPSREERNKAAHSMRARGNTEDDIAKRLGISQPLVSTILGDEKEGDDEE